ncbi:hypothetical protein BMS3Bbin02_01623 [bacterium BMS3Bbin02]|nr:hypothetical protein BMS3Bbin02_01623 [bacterium BMS3Bbin02]
MVNDHHQSPPRQRGTETSTVKDVDEIVHSRTAKGDPPSGLAENP